MTKDSTKHQMPPDPDLDEQPEPAPQPEPEPATQRRTGAVTVSLSAQQTNKLAADLVRQLAGQIGDAEAIALTLRRWHEVLGAQRWGGVCMAAIRITFRDCLTPTPIADVPPGSVAFIERNQP